MDQRTITRWTGLRRYVVDHTRGVRWGLVGASDIAARSIIPGIRAQSGSRVVAVYSRSPERGAEYFQSLNLRVLSVWGVR